MDPSMFRIDVFRPRPAPSPRERISAWRASSARPWPCCWPCSCARGPSPGPPRPHRPRPAVARAVEWQGDETWYEPRVEDFRHHYDRDIANGGKQTWEQYWGWVESFYAGNLFTKGWNARARWLVDVVRSEGERTRLRTELNALGREICAEWSKDYDVRKVGSADLLTWGKMLEKARAGDDGGGAELRRAVDTVRAHQGRKLGAGAAPSR